MSFNIQWLWQDFKWDSEFFQLRDDLSKITARLDRTLKKHLLDITGPQHTVKLRLIIAFPDHMVDRFHLLAQDIDPAYTCEVHLRGLAGTIIVLRPQGIAIREGSPIPDA